MKPLSRLKPEPTEHLIYTKTRSTRLFRVFYSTSFTVLALALLVCLVVTPADTIKQALDNNQLQNVFIVTAAYVLTIVLCLIIKATRIYHVRSTLASIPKYYVPVKKGDLSRRGFRIVKAELVRSAVVAYESRPRGIPLPYDCPENAESNESGDIKDTIDEERKQSRGSLLNLNMTLTRESTTGTSCFGSLPWGNISHADHSPPVPNTTNPKVPPDTHFPTVINRLPLLLSTHASNFNPSLAMPDHGSSMRSYLCDILVELGLVDVLLAEAFITRYEKARFSSKPVHEDEFAELTNMFANILHGIENVAKIMFNTNGEGSRTYSSSSSSSSTSANNTHISIKEHTDEKSVFGSHDLIQPAEPGMLKVKRQRPPQHGNMSSKQGSPPRHKPVLKRGKTTEYVAPQTPLPRPRPHSYTGRNISSRSGQSSKSYTSNNRVSSAGSTSLKPFGHNAIQSTPRSPLSDTRMDSWAWDDEIENGSLSGINMPVPGPSALSQFHPQGLGEREEVGSLPSSDGDAEESVHRASASRRSGQSISPESSSLSINEDGNVTPVQLGHNFSATSPDPSSLERTVPSMSQTSTVDSGNLSDSSSENGESSRFLSSGDDESRRPRQPGLLRLPDNLMPELGKSVSAPFP